MSLYVVKFGGSSVSNTARIVHATKIVVRLIEDGHTIIVVASATQGMTNQLIEFTRNFCTHSLDREYDAVVSAGEQVASGLFALSLKNFGVKAKSVTCWQMKLKTSGEFSEGYIKSVDIGYILQCLADGAVPVVAGFQGISENFDIMTIGRGGSDATACALAYAIKATECLIYTDVDGIYTADPRIVLGAHRLSEVSYDEMLEMASGGAKILQPQSVLIAKKCNVKLKVLSSFSESGATIVSNQTVYIPKDKKITGITNNSGMIKIIIFSQYVKNINLLKIIFQNKNKPKWISFLEMENQTISFLINKNMLFYLKSILVNIDNLEFSVDNDIGVVNLIGSGLKTDQNILKDTIDLLSDNNINVKQMIVSEISVSIVVPLMQVEKIVNILHNFFFV